MKAQGIDVINMSVGEPDFNTPEHIKAAGKKAIDDNYSKYSPVPGYLALRNAISENSTKRIISNTAIRRSLSVREASKVSAIRS